MSYTLIYPTCCIIVCISRAHTHTHTSHIDTHTQTHIHLHTHTNTQKHKYKYYIIMHCIGLLTQNVSFLFLGERYSIPVFKNWRENHWTMSRKKVGRKVQNNWGWVQFAGYQMPNASTKMPFLFVQLFKERDQISLEISLEVINII